MLPNIYALLSADAAVSALVGTRIYRHRAAPQNVAAPYITWTLISGSPENELSERPKVDRCEIQVDCWTNNTGTGDAEVVTMATAVRDALEAHAHMTQVGDFGRDYETQRFRVMMRFTFFLQRSASLPFDTSGLLLLSGEDGWLLLSGDAADTAGAGLEL